MLLQGSVGTWCPTHGAPAPGGAEVSVGFFLDWERFMGFLQSLRSSSRVAVPGQGFACLNWSCEQSSPGKGAAGAWGAGEYRPPRMWGLPSPGDFSIVVGYKPQQVLGFCFFFPAPPPGTSSSLGLSVLGVEAIPEQLQSPLGTAPEGI